ncbi:MAG: pyruvate kinase alpha/beta domain-containing protein, partial [Candidatus Zipacnadales bacterium]
VIVGHASSTDEQVGLVDQQLRVSGLLKAGEKVVITAGTPIGRRGTTNLMKLHVIGDTEK